MTPIFPGKLAHSPLGGAGDSVIATPLCCHLPSEQTQSHKGARGWSFLTLQLFLHSFPFH